MWAAFFGGCQPHPWKSFALVDVSQSPKQQRCFCLNSLLQHTCTVGREGTCTQTRLVQLWELDSMRSSWVPSNSRSSMINLPAAMDGIVRAETGACTPQCTVPSTHHLLLPSLSDGSRGSARSLTEHLATGLNQQRTARFHFAPDWEIPEKEAGDPWRAVQEQGWCWGSGRNCPTAADAPSCGASSAFPSRRCCRRLHRGAAVREEPCPFPQAIEVRAAGCTCQMSSAKVL